MEPTRRGMMGLFAGAVAAGPKLAESVISEVSDAAAMIAPADHHMKLVNATCQGAMTTLPGNAAGVPSSPDVPYGMTRIRRIKELLRGSDDNLCDGYYSPYIGDNQNIQSLKSVSKVNKKRMKLEASRRRHAAERRLSLTNELVSLMTGGFGIKSKEHPW